MDSFREHLADPFRSCLQSAGSAVAPAVARLNERCESAPQFFLIFDCCRKMPGNLCLSNEPMNSYPKDSATSLPLPQSSRTELSLTGTRISPGLASGTVWVTGDILDCSARMQPIE